MKPIFRTLKTIYSHQFNRKNKISGLLRFIKWHISCRLMPYPIIFPFTESSKLIIERGVLSVTGQLYNGIDDYNDMGFLLHFLRADDLFFDIGANNGTYTILASAEVCANSVTIEPIPSTFKRLLDNVTINYLDSRVKPKNIGLGSKKGVLKFTNLSETIDHVATDIDENTINVNVETLDFLSENYGIPSLIKIDVEGFEMEVLLGGKKTLADSGLKAIIIELNGSGNRYGYDDQKIHDLLIESGFEPYFYNPESRSLKKRESFGKRFNTIYIRDIEYVNKRVVESRQIKIGSTRQKL